MWFQNELSSLAKVSLYLVILLCKLKSRRTHTQTCTHARPSFQIKESKLRMPEKVCRRTTWTDRQIKGGTGTSSNGRKQHRPTDTREGAILWRWMSLDVAEDLGWLVTAGWPTYWQNVSSASKPPRTVHWYVHFSLQTEPNTNSFQYSSMGKSNRRLGYLFEDGKMLHMAVQEKDKNTFQDFVLIDFSIQSLHWL